MKLTESQIINACADFQNDDLYYADTKYISNSMLGLLKKSPKELARYFNGHKETTNAMTFGRAFHLSILEPEKFSDKVAIWEGKTKRGNAWDEFSSANKERGRDIISTVEFECIKGMEDVITSNEDIVEVLFGEGRGNFRTEVPMVWQDSLSSVLCKGKVDVLRNDGIIVDIKTTQDASFEAFRRSAYKYGYNRQSAFYVDGFNAKGFVFIVIEKKAPYNVGVYECSEEFIESGRVEYLDLLMRYRNYFTDADLENYDITHYYETGIL